MALHTTQKTCPRCIDTSMRPRFGALLEDVCPRCRGRFVASDGVDRLLIEEHGLSRGLLREMVGLFTSRERIDCPDCHSKLSPLHVRHVRVDLCTGCGGAWLDAGELARLSEGRHAELSPEPATDAGRIGDGALRLVPTVSSERAEEVDPELYAVFLLSPDAVTREGLVAAFARCPGLTAQDAAFVARRRRGIAVEGVSAAVADEVVAALAACGIAAARATYAWITKLPPAISSIAFDARDDALTVGRGDASSRFQVPWQHVAAVTAATLPKSSVRRSLKHTLNKHQRRMHEAPGPDYEIDVVHGQDSVLELYLLHPGRRVRIAQSAAIFGEAGLGRDKHTVFAEGITAIASRVPATCGLGHGVRALLAGERLPRVASSNDLDRELSWLLWRLTQPR